MTRQRKPRSRRAKKCVVMSLGLAAAAPSSGTALAGNAAEPRVPPSFLGGECLEVLRPGDAPLHLTIGVPLEETESTDDEPPGTRSFQFFAACREPFPGEELPPWIDAADIEASQAANPEILTPDDALVLPTSRWADCLEPLTGMQPRMPITCEGTASGVDIAADALPPGNHVLYGYTYEPDKNVWTPRSGVLRVVGPEGEAALPPAVAFSYPVSDVVASTGLGVTLTGCATGNGGTTVEFAWATASDLVAFGDEAWETFETLDLDDDDPAFAVPFVPPADSDYKVVKFRALASDPDGGRWVAYTRQPMVLEPGCAEPQDGTELVADVCGFGSSEPEPTDAAAGMAGRSECPPRDDETGSTGDSASETGMGGGDGTTAAGTASDGPDVEAADDGRQPGGGCACSSRPASAGGPLWLLALVGLTRRRRAAAPR